MGKNKRIQHKPSHILVIRLSAMGDVAMTVPVLAAMSQQYPDVKITVLTRAFFAPMFAQLPNVTVYEADVKGQHKGVLGLWKLYRSLKGLGIDAVADLHNVLRSNILKTYFTFSGLPFEQVDKGRADKKALTAAVHKVFKPLTTTHQRYAEVFARLGYPLDLEAVSLPAKRPLQESTRSLIQAPTQPWIGIAPFAAFEGKMYPIALMQEVVGQLNATNAYRILLFGGGKKEGEELQKWEDAYPNCLNMVGKISFEEELALISQLDLMLAMDSGNAHMAAMFGLPTLTLWGVTHPYAGFYPFGQPLEHALMADRMQYPLIPTSVYGNKFPPGYENAMQTIAPEAVVQKIQHILSGN
ncbi:glycosyltransferase family 9 protein [Arenibacter sp. 6A1]|uniref:glycosyltransferase family 9 protein n=1 Tax=Arenibacter sp. 6A1 TaxID=2720391 RepID=UPI00293BC1DB|nr:glycosyltransferase family 9 protein [Arenibacter sp. 6A1]